jgi:hypothetical protein
MQLIWFSCDLRIFMASLISFGNKLVIEKCLSRETVIQLHQYCLEVAQWWNTQEEETRKKKEEEDAMYVFKGKERNMERTDEEQEEFDLMNTFPSFEEDYHDLEKVVSLEDGLKIQREQRDDEKLSVCGELSSDDVDLFLRVHATAVSFMSNHWICKGQATTGSAVTKCDMTTPFMNV